MSGWTSARLEEAHRLLWEELQETDHADAVLALDTAMVAVDRADDELERVA